MIQTKKELSEYLSEDFKAYFEGAKDKPSFLQRVFSKQVKFILLLRKAEYYTNNKSPLALIYRLRLRIVQEKCMYSVPLNVLGKGSVLTHIGPVIINPGAIIGEHCRIHVGVNIGTAAGERRKAPRIGNNVYIGPGAKLFGDITIADNIAIGANAVVNKSFVNGGVTLAGVPARVVSNKGSVGLIKH